MGRQRGQGGEDGRPLSRANRGFSYSPPGRRSALEMCFAQMEFKTLLVITIGRYEFERQDGNSEALFMAAKHSGGCTCF